MEYFAYLNKLHQKYHNEYKNNRNRNPYLYKELLPKSVNVLDDLSDIDSMVLETEDNIIIANRGLDVKTIRDLVILKDMLISSKQDSKYNEILNKDREKINKIKELYDKPIILTGYSRGGKKSFDLGNELGLEYHAFNPADTTTLINNIVGKTDKISNQLQPSSEGNIYRTALDVISIGYNGTIIPPNPDVNYFSLGNALSNHHIDHFINDETFIQFDKKYPQLADPEISILPSSNINFTEIDAYATCGMYKNLGIPEPLDCRILLQEI